MRGRKRYWVYKVSGKLIGDSPFVMERYQVERWKSRGLILIAVSSAEVD
jgi:hypothetical protein